MNPRVKDVVARDDYKLEITFMNGEVGVFDCAHLLSFGVFQELQDISYFKQARRRMAPSCGRTSRTSVRIRSMRIRRNS